MKIEVQHLTRVFGKAKAVDDLSFSFSSGDVVGFVGPNGAGKTTTMNIMATLDEPTAGDVLLDGRSVLDYPDEARRRIGFMPDGLPSRSDITAHEYVDFYGRAFGLRRQALADAVARVEDFTGVAPIRDKVLSALSKGMKQRVSLARALVHDPELLIMDEPANGLDPRARIELRELVKVLAEQGKAILVSSHILTELAEMCTSVVIIEKGKLLSGGGLEEVSRKADPGTHLSLRAAAGTPQDALVRALLESPGVTRAVPRGPFVSAAVDGGEEAVSALLSSLFSRGVPVVECRVEAANLEDVFMNVTKGDIA